MDTNNCSQGKTRSFVFIYFNCASLKRVQWRQRWGNFFNIVAQIQRYEHPVLDDRSKNKLLKFTFFLWPLFSAIDHKMTSSDKKELGFESAILILKRKRGNSNMLKNQTLILSSTISQDAIRVNYGDSNTQQKTNFLKIRQAPKTGTYFPFSGLKVVAFSIYVQ